MIVKKSFEKILKIDSSIKPYFVPFLKHLKTVIIANIISMISGAGRVHNFRAGCLRGQINHTPSWGSTGNR